MNHSALPGNGPGVSDLMTPGEVAEAFRVDPKTVTRWANAGRLSTIRTPGGHRRFHRGEVMALATDWSTGTQPGERQ